MKFELKEIGRVEPHEHGFIIRIHPEFKKGLYGLDGFSMVNVIWWADRLDSEDFRNTLELAKPYKNGPDMLGVFATRSPLRPNPVAVTPVSVSGIDFKAGILYTPYIDADKNTPVIDIKPYHGSTDRAEHWNVPVWCSGWPESIEGSAAFDWESVFNF